MTKRTWKIVVKGNEYTICLNYSKLGQREVFVNGLPVAKENKYWDYGSQYQFSVDGSVCELGIVLNGIKYDYYLTLDGVLHKAHEDNSRQFPSKAVQQAVSEAGCWRELGSLSGLAYIPVPDLHRVWRYRLIGYVSRYLVVVRYGVMPKTSLPVIMVLIRCARLSEPKDIHARLYTELIERNILAGNCARLFEVQHNFVVVPFSYPKAELPGVISEKITLLMEVVRKYISPHLKEKCEGVECKLPIGQNLVLAFVNDVPLFLCENCIDNIPEMGNKSKKAYLAAPSGLLKGFVIGSGAAVLGGIVWAIVAVLLDRIAAILGAAMFIFVLKAMDKIGTKRTVFSLILAATLGMFGVFLGSYLSLVFYALKDNQGLTFSLLQAAWEFLWEDNQILSMSVFFGLLGILPYFGTVWLNQKQHLTILFNPRVELLKNLPFEK